MELPSCDVLLTFRVFKMKPKSVTLAFIYFVVASFFIVCLYFKPLVFWIASFFIRCLYFKPMVFLGCHFFIGGLCFNPLTLWDCLFLSNVFVLSL
jgi:hypothetical protein